MDRIVNRVISFEGVTIFSVAEAVAVTKYMPNYMSEHTLLFAFIPLYVINLVFYLLYLAFIYPFLFDPLRHFPTSKVPGSMFMYGVRYTTISPPGSQFVRWIEETPNDGIILLRSVFHKNRVFVTNPQTISDLLVTRAYDFVKNEPVRSFLREALGDGLILVEGDVHKFQRKHVMPAFSFRHIKDLYPMMWRKATSLVECLQAELAESTPGGPAADGVIQGTTEINKWASKVTLDIIGIAGLGREFNALKNQDDALVRDYEELLTPTTDRLALFLLWGFLSPVIARLALFKTHRTFKTLTSSLVSISRQLVLEKREAVKAGADDNFDILSLLIKSNDFSDDELVSQILTFLAAGHETTSSAFTWLAYLLAIYPDAQKRLREEVREMLPNNPANDSSFDFSGVLESMPYLNAVCNETLRLYPTVPVTVRKAIRDTQLGNHFIPKDTEIFISPWGLNRSPDMWGPDSQKFVPERWITDGRPNNNGGAESNYCLMTFLHGPRSCIGQNFAKAELRCLVAAFVGAFEWELDMRPEDVVPAGVITIKPKDGLHLKLKSVGQW